MSTFPREKNEKALSLFLFPDFLLTYSGSEAIMRKIDLGSEKTFPVILRLALPAMVAQLVSVLYNVVDRIYVGNMQENGAIALVGVGVCAPITSFISSFAFLVGLGAGPLFSMALGEKREDQAKKILSDSLWMLLIVSVLVLLTFYPTLRPMLYAFGASDSSYPYAYAYLSIYLIGTFFSILTLGLNEFITAQGDSLSAMLTTLIGCLLNVGLDPLFMYALNLGVRGAAIATVVCQAVSFLFVLFILLRKSVVRLSFSAFDFLLAGKILRLGFSPFIIMATDSVVIIALNSVLERTGKDEGDTLIETATIVQAFESLVTGPLLGISSGTQPILGYDFGARKTALIRKAEKQIVLFGLVFTSVCFALSFALARPFATLFLGLQKNQSSDPTAVIDASVRFIRVYMYGIIPLSFQYVFVDGLTGMGQAKYSIWLSLNRKMVLLLPLVFLLPLWTGKAESAFYAEMIADIVSGAVSSAVYLLLVPKILRKQENTPIQNPKKKTV
jgi:putative MATE family efflux protein